MAATCLRRQEPGKRIETPRPQRKGIEAGEKNAKKIIDIIKSNLETEPLARVDYVEVVDFENIQRVDTISGETLVAIAVYIGKTRLIDNFITVHGA